MNIPINLEILESLYQNGQITGEGLAAIAPIRWLSINHPELINTEVKMRQAMAVTEKLKNCKDCVHFSSTHQCCMSRVDESMTYLPVKTNSIACIDYEEVSLPYFLKRGGNDDKP